MLALNVPEEIDYGNLSVTETSEVKEANVTNWGNGDIVVEALITRDYNQTLIDVEIEPHLLFVDIDETEQTIFQIHAPDLPGWSHYYVLVRIEFFAWYPPTEECSSPVTIEIAIQVQG